MEGHPVARIGALVMSAALVVAATACGEPEERARDDASDTPRASAARDREGDRDRARATRSPRARSADPTPGATPFDEDRWRQLTIDRFGPEREFSDGSKENYVEQAEALCATENRPQYERDSIQRWMEETYCPHA